MFQSFTLNLVRRNVDAYADWVVTHIRKGMNPLN